MAIREELVVSAVNYSKIAFLKSKNLTQEEIDVALARAGATAGAAAPSQVVVGPVQQSPAAYYGQYQQAPPYGWQAQPPLPPRRDWRDYFILATVLAGVGTGLYVITKRYVYPLVAPPTPEKLEQDKAAVDAQFDKAFATIEQLSKDTEALKASEQDRTEKLDKILTDLETFVRDTKSASLRQDGETDRLRTEMKSLKEVIPKTLNANKEFTDGRLREIANEVKSLKSLIGQRMSNSAPTATATVPSSSNSYVKPASSSNAAAVPPSPSVQDASNEATASSSNGNNQTNGEGSSTQASKQDYLSSLGGRASPFGASTPGTKASIPAWQLAMANKSAGADSTTSSTQNAAGSSS